VSTGRNVPEAIGGGSMLIKEYRICMPISVEEVFHKNGISKNIFDCIAKPSSSNTEHDWQQAMLDLRLSWGTFFGSWAV
jgi:hypothetical protein